MLLDVASMALGKSLDRWGDGWGPGRDSIHWQTSSSNSDKNYQNHNHLRRRFSTNSFSTPPGNGSSATVAAT